MQNSSDNGGVEGEDRTQKKSLRQASDGPGGCYGTRRSLVTGAGNSQGIGSRNTKGLLFQAPIAKGTICDIP